MTEKPFDATNLHIVRGMLAKLILELGLTEMREKGDVHAVDEYVTSVLKKVLSTAIIAMHHPPHMENLEDAIEAVNMIQQQNKPLFEMKDGCITEGNLSKMVEELESLSGD